MNLKEAFRYQNKLQRLMDEAQCLLRREENVTTVEVTNLLHKIDPEQKDETVAQVPTTEYAGVITQIASFLMFLLNERERLSNAIREAKRNMPLDFDGEVSLNSKRQEIAAVFRQMAELRGSERVYPKGGTAYRFNAEGNQVSYCCDVKKVTTINFDRNKVRSYLSALNRKSDEMSGALDKCMVNTEVCYEAPFDVNDTFADALERYMGAES